MSWKAACLAALIAAGRAGAPAGGEPREEAVTLWVLPFENLGGDPALDDLARAVSELLTLSFARSEYAVVERERLAAVLAEQSLASAGLSEPGTRRTVGRLLGARWMLHGSLARRGTKLWIAAHVTELESTRILASEQMEAEPAELASMLGELAGRLLHATRARLGGTTEKLDPTPEANLHFLRGLSHYYSGQHHRALAEFLRSGAEPGLADSSALWRANCYLGLEKYAHAFLELVRLQRRSTNTLDPAALQERIEHCRRALSAEELRDCENLLRAAR